MDIILFGDVFDNILMRLLIPIDLYNLVQTCKQYQKKIKMSHIKKSTIQEINRRSYGIFGNDLNNFKDMMRQSNAIISGSFVLQCILGEYWAGSDIDIYVNTKIFDEFFYPSNKNLSDIESDDQKSDNSELSECENSNSDESSRKNILEYMRDENYFMERVCNDYGGSPIYIIEFKINKTKIQFIGATGKNLTSYIIKNYDFNICKNVYKCENISGENIFIYRLNEIFSKYTNFAPKYDLEKNINRYSKYRDRGFNFYSCVKDNLITNNNIWGHFNIDIIKIKPINKSYDQCKSITSKNYEYACKKNIIRYTRESQKKINGKKIFKILDNKSSFSDLWIYSCNACSFKCLFNGIYPDVHHLHSAYTTDKFTKSILFILDDFNIDLC